MILTLLETYRDELLVYVVQVAIQSQSPYLTDGVRRKDLFY